MNIRDRQADEMETMIRDPKGPQVKFLVFGCPLIGAVLGTITNAVALLVCISPTPYEFVVATFLIAVSLQLFDLPGMLLEEHAGDLANRGMTRVYKAEWIPFHLRKAIGWNGEPWRTTFITSLILLTVVNSGSVIIPFSLTGYGTWLAAIVIGMIVATSKGLLSKKTWDNLRARPDDVVNGE